MNIFNHFRHLIIRAIKDKYPLIEDAILQRINVEIPKDKSHGDFATNAAFILAKPLGKAPAVIGQELVSVLESFEGVHKSALAGGGFVNTFLTSSFIQAQLKNILDLKDSYGESEIGQKQSIHVEYVSANPTGPLHAGHARNAVIGDVLVSLLKKVGYKVHKEFYVNDAGGQIKMLARSLYVRYLEQAGVKDVDVLKGEDFYPGDYIIPVAQSIYAEKGDFFVNKSEAEWLDYFSDYGIKEMMNLIKQDLAQLGIVMDTYSSEKEIVGKGQLEKAKKRLEDKGDIYTGTLPKPKGEDNPDWEPRPQLLFQSTKFGDDVDRALQKSDGSWTYFAGDLAYHLDKFERNFDYYINVMSADHGGYFKRIKSGFYALSNGTRELEIKGYQLVNFLENGVPIRMSKRAGNFVLLSDIIEKVGKDAIRFMMVSRHHDMEIDFDFKKVQEQSKDNPVFYVQYAYARCSSVLRHGKEVFPEISDTTDFSILEDESELNMIKSLCVWPKIVESAAIMREPHRIANALVDIASDFHAWWSQGRENTQLRLIVPDNKLLSEARLSLIKAVLYVLASGFNLLGITAREEM